MSSSGSVPFFDLTRQYQETGESIRLAVDSVLRSQQFILGESVRRFEISIADHLDIPDAVGVASGTDALLLLLRAAGLSSGDAVLVPSFTFYASASAICLAGGVPLWSDVDPDLFLVNPETLDQALTTQAIRSPSGEWRTRVGDHPVKGVLPVHLYGQMPDMRSIHEWAAQENLWVVEDACQAIGAMYDGKGPGHYSIGAAYSFFPTKNLGGAGDGGLVSTKDPAISVRVRSLRVHGSRQRYIHEELGYNSRLDAIQAAVLETKLPYLPRWNARRRQLAERYSKAFSGQHSFSTPVVSSRAESVFHQYTISFHQDGEQERVRMVLAGEGIGSEIYYPVPQHRQEAFRHLLPVNLPVTDRLSGSVLSLPVFPELTDDEQERVIRAVLNAISNAGM
ncbi:MAG: DegT/DnrJ/EryC1/StrS family aminotransferase [Leptospirales bacterium]